MHHKPNNKLELKEMPAGGSHGCKFIRKTAYRHSTHCATLNADGRVHSIRTGKILFANAMAFPGELDNLRAAHPFRTHRSDVNDSDIAMETLTTNTVYMATKWPCFYVRARVFEHVCVCCLEVYDAMMLSEKSNAGLNELFNRAMWKFMRTNCEWVHAVSHSAEESAHKMVFRVRATSRPKCRVIKVKRKSKHTICDTYRRNARIPVFPQNCKHPKTQFSAACLCGWR